ncbi:MAG: RNA polymerase sigma factor [Saprospirales bacterium]|nr:RNA polymerase sigma factor [Saprospirales bacterium]MBK8923269.1 RNA polymerase sigma factor [Saprospirales bacterium]
MSDMPLKQLIAGCGNGDSKAQRALFDRYQSPLFCVCLRYARDRPEAQDMLQEAFLAIYRDIGQYNGSGALDAWMHRVAVRSALQYLRRKNPLRFAEDYDGLPANTWNVSPDLELNGETILRIVQQLPDGYRTVFNLHCMEAYSYAEIAAELGIAESTARSQYTRACRHLRGLLEKILTNTF